MTAVAPWVLTYLLQSTLLLGVAWVVSRLLRGRAAAVETVWRVSLLGSVVAPLLIATGLMRPLTGIITVGDHAMAVMLPAAADVGERPTERADQQNGPTRRSVAANPAAIATTTPDLVESATTTTEAREANNVLADLRLSLATLGDASWRGLDVTAGNWTRLVVAAWMTVATLLLAWHFIRRRRLFALLTSRVPVSEPHVVAMFSELCQAAGLRRAVRMTASTACPVPMALTAAEVCVPTRFLSDLDSAQQRGALAHEIAHVARRDPQWLTVDAVIGSMLFFQPLNRVARRNLREVAESQCDEWAAQQGAGLGLARCLADVASWVMPFPRSLLAVTISMAANQSELVTRVERLLTDVAGMAPSSRVRPLAAACLIVATVAVGVPAFSAGPPDAPTDALLGPKPELEPEPEPDAVLAADSSTHRSAEVQPQIIRPTASGALSERWAAALRDARARSQTAFWVGYRFDSPLRPDQQHVSDSRGIDMDEDLWKSVKLGEALGLGTSDGIAIFAHYRGSADARVDRISHRSMNAPMDFGGDAVFWLGAVGDGESVPWLDALQQRMPTPALRSELVEALSMHRTTAIVLLVLDRLLGSERDAQLRAEAAEGLEYHDTPAALQLAHRVATRDNDPAVRAEAAEAIGEMPIAGAVGVLVELASTSDDPGVRSEAAEALGSQPAADALRGIEAVVFDSPHEDARSEAVEALGELAADAALPLLRRMIWDHPNTGVRVEAVETIGDLEGLDVVPELSDVLARHPDHSVRNEALEVLSDADTPAAYALILEIATRADSADTRRDAIEAVAEAGEKGRTDAEIEQAATLLEAIIFQDRDESVQREAIDAVAQLPRQRALGILRRVADTHPSSRIRREAIEAIAEMTRY